MENASVAGIGITIASQQAGAPFTLKNLIAVCIVTELLQLLSLGRYYL
jgi:minor histocompatibility antigen H13